MVSALVIHDVAAAIEHLHDPGLKDTPTVLLTGNKLLRVLATDASAHRAGVEIGATRNQAELVCPHATLLPAREAVYRRVFTEVTTMLLKVIAKVEPHYQPTSALWYVKTDDPHELAILRDTITNRLGIPVTSGTAPNKFVARTAAALTTQAWQSVSRRDAPNFLAPAPVTLLPVKPDMLRRLWMMGVYTIGQYAALPRAAVFAQWGQHGRWCHDLAQGIDPRPIQSFTPPLVFTETTPFDTPVTDKDILFTVCLQLAPRLIAQLNGREARRVVLVLACEDDTTHEVHLQPSVAIRDRAQMQRQLPALLDKPTYSAGVTRITLEFSEVTDVVPTQLSLFDWEQPKDSLDKAVIEWQHQFYEDVFQPTLTDAPRILPPEYQYDYVAVSA